MKGISELLCSKRVIRRKWTTGDEGIIRNARDGDIGAIFGIGFPPFLGGPFNYIDNLGAASIVNKLNQWSSELGERFKPCQALTTMAENGTKYYS